MKILIEALGVQDFGGGRTATLNTLRALLKHYPENSYTVLFSQPEPTFDAYSNCHQIVAPTTNRFGSRVWLQLVMPRLARQHDLVHFMKNLSVFGLGRPVVVTIYDMTTLIHTELFPKVDVYYWQTIQRLTMRQAVKTIAISENTRHDIQQFYAVPDSRLATVYPAVDERFRVYAQDETATAAQKYDITKPYIIHVGRLDPKNNIVCLIEAFARLDNWSDWQLVLVGGIYQKTPETSIEAAVEKHGLQRAVICTGRVPDADLPALISGATVAVFPSHHEGFGLAALESLACGTPAIVHAAGALAEAVDDAAIVLDTIEPETLAVALTDLLADQQLQATLNHKGLQRRKQFTLEKHAAETEAVYRAAIEGH